MKLFQLSVDYERTEGTSLNLQPDAVCVCSEVNPIIFSEDYFL